MPSSKQLALFAIILMLHLSLLNLFFVTANGPVFLWQQNMRWQTVLIHVFTVALGSVILCLINYIYQRYINKTNEKNDEN